MGEVPGRRREPIARPRCLKDTAPPPRTEPAVTEPDGRTVIRFYSTAGEYGCFSNFSRHRVFLKGEDVADERTVLPRQVSLISVQVLTAQI